jgi:hypothetical protein
MLSEKWLIDDLSIDSWTITAGSELVCERGTAARTAAGTKQSLPCGPPHRSVF